MTSEVYAAVICAALLHAVWNAMIKVRLDRFLSISLMSLAMGTIALMTVPFVPLPSGQTWIWIVASAALHTGYKIFLIKAYEAGDMAQAYPLARGAAPLLTFIGGIVMLGETPGVPAVAGLVVLSAGVWLMSARGGRVGEIPSGQAVGYALTTAAFIACYTLVDAVGARGAVTVSSYAAWMFVIDGFWMFVFCLALRGPRALAMMAPEWRTGALTGIFSVSAYWMVMWAMTRAPVAQVAALRETSILFAVLISIAFLGEPLTRWRAAASLAIVAGAVALKGG